MGRRMVKRLAASRREAMAAVCAISLMSCAPGALALESSPVASGLSAPLFVTAPEGDARLFIVEKGGAIKVMSGGSLLPNPFLDIGGLVRTNSESGLLGLAFDPNFAVQGAPGYRTFYVNYIDRTTRSTVVASYQVSAASPNLADPATARTILTVPQAPYDNHKAGWIGFRPGEPDNLYIATGDGGSGNDPGNRAQNLTNNLGKMLRVNVHADDFPADAGRNYAIPANNPFVGRAGNDEIWAYGLRNPYRNSFDRLTGDLYIADVGQDSREEIDFEPADFAGGANYGWRAREGSGDNPGVGDAPPANAVNPILDYPHSFGASVIGGYVDRSGRMPELEGAYLFGDYISDRIWAIRYEGSFIAITGAMDVTDLFNPVDPMTGQRMITGLSSFGEDGFGGIYLVDLGGGTIYAMVPEPETWAMLLVMLVPAILVARRRG